MNFGYRYTGSGDLSVSNRLGYEIGAYYNFPTASRFTVGFDARFAQVPAVAGGTKGFVSGRIGFVPYHVPLRPYFQLGGGFVHTKVPKLVAPYGTQTTTAPAVDLALGLDIRLTQHLDLRLPELESGAGGNGTYTVGSASFTTGVVYHFSPR